MCLGPPANNSAVTGQYWPLTLPSAPTDIIVPTAVNALASGSFVYVTAYDASTPSPVGYVFAFSVGSGGVLTPLNGGTPFAAGSQPSAIASDATSSYLYVTDTLKGTVWGFSVSSGGALTALSGSPYPTGGQPSSVVVDPSYPFAYVTNSQDSTLTAYSMSNGVLTSIGTYATGLQPVAIGIDPSTNHFLYTVNYLGNNVSGFELSPTQGTLLVSQYSPFGSNAQPVAVAAVPHNGTGGGVQ